MTPIDPFDAQANRSLTDEQLWLDLTATDAGRKRMRVWLHGAIAANDGALATRKAVLYDAYQTLDYHGRQKAHYEYRTWKAKAVKFKGLAIARLKRLDADIKEANIAEAARQRADEATIFRRALIDLAALVADHQDGTITTTELHAALDNITVPHSGHSEVSLRAVVADTFETSGANT